MWYMFSCNVGWLQEGYGEKVMVVPNLRALVRICIPFSNSEAVPIIFNAKIHLAINHSIPLFA